VSAGSFEGNGARITDLDCSKITSGALPDSRLSANVPLINAASNAFTGAMSATGFKGDGSALTALDASKITLGKLSNLRLTPNIPRKNARLNSFTGNADIAGTVTAGSFAGRSDRPIAVESSGRATVGVGRRSVRVTRAGLLPTDNVIATLQSRAGDGIAISHVKVSADKFEVFLTAPAQVAARLAFLVLAGQEA
jgi:hypothetical protein